MGKPITTIEPGICFAFPDVCKTPIPVPPGFVAIPYPNIGQLADAKKTADTVKVGGKEVVTSDSYIETTIGDEAGSQGGIKSNCINGEVRFKAYSKTVKAQGGYVVRMFDSTTQNTENAVGQVLGGNPTVLVGD